MHVAVISPPQSRRFSQALGPHVKTDRIDAAMLARLGQAMDPEAAPPREDAQFWLADLSPARAQLVASGPPSPTPARSIQPGRLCWPSGG